MALTKQAALQVKMQQPFDFKVNYAEIRINEFINEMGKLDKNCAVSVGGLDSIVLYCFIKQFYSDIPAISVSAIEDKTVRAIHNYTTGAARTGCDICGFGIQFEKTRPHRFDVLYQENPHKWNFYINTLRYGELFEHIGFAYKQPFTPGDLSWK